MVRKANGLLLADPDASGGTAHYHRRMCLIAFSWKQHPRFRLALVANRDEFHARPALPAQAHADAPGVYGGRDLEKGGSWLLVSGQGRFAAVTNVRAGRQPEGAARSRGDLVDGFVKSTLGLDDFIEILSARAMEYGRFNLLLGDGDRLLYAGNHPRFRVEAVSPGLHAVSNGDLDAPWPKALRVRDALASWLDDGRAAEGRIDNRALFDALRDTRRPPDADLPDTGVGLELERLLSSPFIVGENYGTRASTIVLADSSGTWLHERRHGANGVDEGGTELFIAARAILKP